MNIRFNPFSWIVVHRGAESYHADEYPFAIMIGSHFLFGNRGWSENTSLLI
jgi:hypothetical protein